MPIWLQKDESPDRLEANYGSNVKRFNSNEKDLYHVRNPSPLPDNWPKTIDHDKEHYKNIELLKKVNRTRDGKNFSSFDVRQSQTKLSPKRSQSYLSPILAPSPI
jgi:hypothetical protein